MREETRCHHIGYSFQLAARVLSYASSHRQDNAYHSLCYTSRGALAGPRNSSMGPLHEGSIRRPIAPWANTLTTELHLASMVSEGLNMVITWISIAMLQKLPTNAISTYVDIGVCGIYITVCCKICQPVPYLLMWISECVVFTLRFVVKTANQCHIYLCGYLSEWYLHYGLL